MTAMNSSAGAGEGPALIVNTDRSCAGCGYNVRGLSVSGVCPECAKPVAETLRAGWLKFSSAQYLEDLHRGVVVVLVSLAGQLVVRLAGIATTLALVLFRASESGSLVGARVIAMVTVGFEGLGLLAYLAQCLGLWLFTRPDPGFSNVEQPNSARRVVRVMVLVLAGIEFVQVSARVFGGVPGAGGTGAFGAAAAGLMFATVIAELVCWVVQFFAMMGYLAWLGRRVPDEPLIRQTRLFMWLLPVLFTVGWLAAGLGPVVALVLYWTMLNRVRRHLLGIRGKPAFGGGVGPAGAEQAR